MSRAAIAVLIVAVSAGPLYALEEGADREPSAEPSRPAESTSSGLLDPQRTLSVLQRLRLHPGRDCLGPDEAIRNRPPVEMPAARTR